MPPKRGVPIIDRHDRIFPREGSRTSSTWVFLKLIDLGEEPRGLEVFYHIVVL
jgi:hypothetical protein